jgi:hypothetical protein
MCRLAIALSLFAPLICAQRSSPLQIENDYVRVLDVTDTPHHIGKMHDHKVNRVMIYLTKGDIRITGADGKIDDQHWKPGDVAWGVAGGMHTSEVVGDSALRIIEVELKPGEGRKEVAAGPLDPVKVDQWPNQV